MILALITAILYGLRGVIAKLAYAHDITVAQLMIIRFSLAIIVLWVFYLKLSDKKKLATDFQKLRKSYLSILIAGVLFGISTAFDFTAVKLLPANIERIIVLTFPAVIIVLEAIKALKLPRPFIVVNFVVSYLGIILILANHEYDNDFYTLSHKGIIIAIATSIVYASYNSYIRPAIKEFGAFAFTTFSSTVSGAFIILYFIAQAIKDTNTFNQTGFLLVTFITIFCSLIPSITLAEAIKRIGAIKVGIIYMFSPAVTIISAYFLLGEKLNMYQIFGVIVTILSISMLKFSKQKSSSK